VWLACCWQPLLTSVSAMRIAERRRRCDWCGVRGRSCRCAGVTPRRKRPCCCTTGSRVLDRERHDVDSKRRQRQRLVRRERRARRQTSRASACGALHHRLQGQYGWCLRSVRHPASTTTRSAASTARGASRSFCSGPRRPPLARVTQAERRELRLAVSSAVGSESAIEGGSVRAVFEQRLLLLASGVDALLAAHVPLVHDARARSSTVSSTASASRCAASTRWR
jgi:hypothetical protein